MPSDQELKAQGAVEAAQTASVDPDAVEHALMQQAREGGANAYEFDPDMSPEEKAAAVRERAGPGLHRKHQVAALATDADDGEDAGYDLPPPTTSGAITETLEEDKGAADPKKPDYSRAGWEPRFGNPADQEEDQTTLLDHQDFLEARLDDKFFGDWYHNTAVIIFACLSSWVVAVLGGGLAWVFLIMAACGTYYRTSLRRVRRNIRNELATKQFRKELEIESETLGWMNVFLDRFWPIFEPNMEAIVIGSVDQVLQTSKPAFLDDLKLKKFTLGNRPPRMEFVKSYPKADDDTIIMDWKFSFTPNNTTDLTETQKKNLVNPKVVLEVRVGKAMISKGLDVIVEDMACAGTMRIKLKLQIPYPHVERAEVCFLEPPHIDYVCKPLGGDTLGFDINFVPGLESFIQSQIHANLGPMFYAPNFFPVEIAKMLAGTPVDQAIGVLQVHFHGAQGLKNPDKFSGTPDPYATVSINNRDVLGKTKTVHENANPRWTETVSVILTSLRDPLTINVFDFNEYRKDKELGTASFELEKLEKQPEHENLQLEVLANGRPRGNVQCDIRFFPVLEPRKLDDGQEVVPESQTGIAKWSIEQIKDLDGTKSLAGNLNPYAVLLLNGKEVQISKKLKRTNNPIWSDGSASKELLISDRKKATLGLIIKDDRELATDPIVASYTVKLEKLLKDTHDGVEWFYLGNTKTGRAKMSLQWKPVALKGFAGGNGYIDPIGVMRFHFQNAKDLKNLDTVGKSDPYARVLLSGIQKGRTVTWKNNLNPDFDEIFYVPVHSTREMLTVEVMDEENVGKDRSMGAIEIPAAEYMHQGEDGEYMIHDSKNEIISAQLRIGRGQPKGTLNFTVAFYPTLHVADPEEERRENAEAGGEIHADGDKISTNGDTDSRKSFKSANGDANGTATPHGRSNTAGTVGSLHNTTSTKAEEEEMRKALEAGKADQGDVEEVQRKEPPKVRIGPEDLINYESGLIVFTIHEGDLAHSGSYLELVMDDMQFASYTSAKTRSRHHNFNETGDAMVRELDLSRITLRLVSETDKKGNGDEEIVKARLTGSTLETLKRCLYTPQVISLKDEHGHQSSIKVSMRFLPVKMQLDPSESFNNQGNVRVEVLDAADLPSADRNGFSDPFCRFMLDGKEVHKTEVQKKTLHPAWNEFFECPVRSRTGSKFEVNVYDWDFGSKADFLGSATIPLDVLEPFQAQEIVLNLDGQSGSIRLKMLFKPDYITRSRQGSSTFSGTFAAPGKVIGAPVKGVGKVGSAVGGGIFRGATFVGRGFKRRTTSGQQVPEDAQAELRATSMETPVSRPGTAVNGAANGFGHGPSIDGSATSSKDQLQPPTPRTPHQRQKSFGQHSMSPAAQGEPGTASISIISASGFEPDTKLEIHILQDTGRGYKEIAKTKGVKAPEGAATFPEGSKKVPSGAATQFKVAVKNEKTFRDEDLGEAAFFINDQSTGGEQHVQVGSGVVVLRTSFQPTEIASMHSPESPASRHKHLFKAKRDRSVTPSG